MAESCNVCGLREVPGGMPVFKPTTNPLGRQESTDRQSCQTCNAIYPSDRVAAAAKIEGPFAEVCQALGLPTVPLEGGGLAIPLPLYLPDGRVDPRPFIVRLRYLVGTAVFIGEASDPDSKFTVDHAVEHPAHGCIVYLRDRKGALRAVAVPAPVAVEPADPEPDPEPEPVRVVKGRRRGEPEPVEAPAPESQGA